MTTIKPPMTDSYRAIFIFAIAMSFITLLAGNKGGIGTLFWGYVAWMMYKRDNLGLISIFKLSLWVVAFSFFMGFVLLSNRTFEENWFGYTAQGYYLLVVIVGAVDFALLNYFRNIVLQEKSAIGKTPNTTSSGNDSKVFVGEGLNALAETIPTTQNISEVAMLDEQIYLKINDELESGNIDKALWLKLFADLDGDENRTKASYIRNRYGALKNLESAVSKNQTQGLIKSEDESAVKTLASDNVKGPRANDETIHEYISLYRIDRQAALDMINYRIWYSNEMFVYKTYRYEKLEDAIAFAKLEESKTNLNLSK